MLVSRIVSNSEALFLAVRNFGPLTQAFGQPMAEEVVRQVQDCVYALTQGRVNAEIFSQSILTLEMPLGEAGLTRADLRRVCTEIAATPFPTGGDPVLVDLDIYTDLAQAQSACAQAMGYGEEWASRYRADMALAAGFASELAEGSLLTLWRPVRSAREVDGVLHYEAVHYHFDMESGSKRSCSAAHAAIKRLGLAWIVDRYAVLHALRELEADQRPSIAVRVSTSTLQAPEETADGLWRPVLERLKARPEVAARLTIEIAETTSIQELNLLRDRIACFRRLGVRFCVAGFASNDVTFGHLVALDPDIVKVSPVFLQSAVLAPANRRRLHLIYNLAASMAPVVVVDGVDGSAHLQLARVLGTRWVSGREVGQPQISRNWRINGAAAPFSRIEREPANCDAPDTLAGGMR